MRQPVWQTFRATWVTYVGLVSEFYPRGPSNLPICNVEAHSRNPSRSCNAAYQLDGSNTLFYFYLHIYNPGCSLWMLMLFQQWFRIYSEEVPCVQCSQFNTAISLGIIQFRKKYEEFFEFIFASKFYFQNTIRIQKKRRSFIGRKIIFLTGTLNAADADAHITSPTLFFSLSYGNIIARCSRRTTVVRTQSAFTFQYCVPLSAQ